MKYFDKKVSIIGLGYVGMPLAYLAATKGFDVLGIDNNLETVKLLNERKNYPKELAKKIYNNDTLKITATNNYELIKNSDVVIICVPTPTKNNQPDLTILNEVIKSISKFLKKDCLLIIESTVAPGMTRKFIEEELFRDISLEVNKDYHLAYCPERIDPGNKKYWVGNINRVCGASSIEALERTYSFYSNILDSKIICMNSIEEAELVKVWENSMRNVSIAQANLLAILCDKYNFSVSRLMEGLNSKIEQFGLTLSYPGLGPGGHCIPEDIHYLIDTAENNKKIDMQLFKESVKINENMPQYAFDKLKNVLENNGMQFSKLNILMLGISYKPNSSDVRRSQAKVLYDIISKENKNIKVIDHYVNVYEHNLSDKIDNEIKKADIVILSCPHDEFLQIDYSRYKNVKCLLDCWNKIDYFEDLDFIYLGIGR